MKLPTATEQGFSDERQAHGIEQISERYDRARDSDADQIARKIHPSKFLQKAILGGCVYNAVADAIGCFVLIARSETRHPPEGRPYGQVVVPINELSEIPSGLTHFGATYVEARK